MAAFGATWQAVIFGFMGLSFEGGAPKAAPALPEGWEALSFAFYYKGKTWRVAAKKGEEGAAVYPLSNPSFQGILDSQGTPVWHRPQVEYPS